MELDPTSFLGFFKKPKWRPSIVRCSKSGDLLQEDLAKSGYEPKIKYKSLIILL
jgi:hypothetical protein